MVSFKKRRPQLLLGLLKNITCGFDKSKSNPEQVHRSCSLLVKFKYLKRGHFIFLTPMLLISDPSTGLSEEEESDLVLESFTLSATYKKERYNKKFVITYNLFR